MSWLDHILATPAIGIQIIPDFLFATETKKTIAPYINEILSSDGDVKIIEDKGYKIRLSIDRCYHFTLDSSNLIFEYVYSLEQKTPPGGLPETKIQNLEKYSDLVDNCLDKLGVISSLFFNNNFIFHVKRIGIMTRTALDPDQLPPGVQKFYEFLKKPWKKDLVKSETLLLSNLDEKDEWTDRCHHRLNIDTTLPSSQMDFVLDWQRVYNDPFITNKKSEFLDAINDSLKMAIQYFEEFGEGSIDYE